MRVRAAAVAAGIVSFAYGGGVAAADEAEVLRERVDALTRRLEAQDRRIRELEGGTSTRDEVAAAVDAYVAATPVPAALTAEGPKGSAGFPNGKRPFVKEGSNRIEFSFRTQVRYEAFLYGDDARANAVDAAKPHDRSGYELERLLFGIAGSVFCEDLTYRLDLNFGTDEGAGVQKRYAYLDGRYAGDHHVRAGNDKVAFTWTEQVGTGNLAFVDRNLAQQAFRISYDTGLSLWGTFGDRRNAKRFLYKAMATNGEGNGAQVPVFGTDALDTFSDALLFTGLFEWTITPREFRWDEVDHRACEDRRCLDLAVGASAFVENDDDRSLTSPGSLVVRGTGAHGVPGAGPLERRGWNAWVRGQWSGWSWQAEYMTRTIDFTAGSTEPNQEDSAWYVQLHHRFACSNWGVAAKYALVQGDDAWFAGVRTAEMSEFGFAVNYFFWDHSHKVTADVSFVSDNAGVTNKNSGYVVGSSRGVVVEDGVMLRLQWQLQV
jgi:hypothetical protein